MFPGDWIINKQQGSTLVTLETVTPIVVNGSLAINATVAPERVSLRNTTYVNGLTAGYTRSVLRVVTLTTTGEERVGFAFMQNAATLYTGTDAGYAVLMNGLTGFGTPRITIVKFTAGLPTLPTELASTTSFTPPTLGSNFVFEAQWIADMGIFGGTQIIARYATGTSFGSLADVLTFTDTSTPIITSSFEGLAFSKAGTGTFRVLYDETSIYQLS